jgi:hypothetical protein
MIGFPAMVPVTGRGLTERRILRTFMRKGARIQPASLVRGSSRRITIMREPADIRVINRRNCFSSSLQRRCWKRFVASSKAGDT